MIRSRLGKVVTNRNHNKWQSKTKIRSLFPRNSNKLLLSNNNLISRNYNRFNLSLSLRNNRNPKHNNPNNSKRQSL